jgi:hypothetical protein
VPIGDVSAPFVDFHIQQLEAASNVVPLRLDVKLFYRGRIDPSCSLPIDVSPKNFPDKISIKIEQDRQQLISKYAKYGKVVGKDFEDQFRAHPEKGVMHRDKDLSYVVTIENRTFLDLEIKYHRELFDDRTGTSYKKLDDEPVAATLKPREPLLLPGTIFSRDVQVGQAKKLAITVDFKDGKKTSTVIRKVRFEQITIKDYMDIKEDYDDNYEHTLGGPREPCFLVIYSRSKDDPVTEPILATEIECKIVGSPGELQDDDLLWPGKWITFHHPVRGKRKLPWSGKIDTRQ